MKIGRSTAKRSPSRGAIELSTSDAVPLSLVRSDKSERVIQGATSRTTAMYDVRRAPPALVIVWNSTSAESIFDQESSVSGNASLGSIGATCASSSASLAMRTSRCMEGCNKSTLITCLIDEGVHDLAVLGILPRKFTAVVLVLLNSPDSHLSSGDDREKERSK